MIKKFKCGFCKKLNREMKSMTRKGLRKHLREEHGFKRELTNVIGAKGEIIKQDWWIVEDFK